MSYKALKLNVWINPKNGEARVYINTEFVDHRSPIAMADGTYLYANDSNGIDWHHGFNTRQNTISKAQSVALAAKEVINYLGNPSFSELLTRIDACKTKGGNFSFTQYEKKYSLA